MSGSSGGDACQGEQGEKWENREKVHGDDPTMGKGIWNNIYARVGQGQVNDLSKERVVKPGRKHRLAIWGERSVIGVTFANRLLTVNCQRSQEVGCSRYPPLMFLSRQKTQKFPEFSRKSSHWRMKSTPLFQRNPALHRHQRYWLTNLETYGYWYFAPA
jgi:hypothetical protein